MHPLESHTLNIIRRDALIPSGANVVVGVSGGADSVALLAVLSHLQKLLRISLMTVYVDHGLRPGETGIEKAYVADIADRLQAGFAGLEVNALEYSRKMKMSLEHAARDLRYDALRKRAVEFRAPVIATGHTADDQVEEILLRLLRGSGRKGLSGMRTKSGEIVRPFLETEKQDIIAYLADKKIQFLEDSSNSDPRFLRNRVRHDLLPFLEERFDQGIRQALRKTAHNLAEDENVLENLTAEACERIVSGGGADEQPARRKLLLNRQLFGIQPAALQRRIAEKILWTMGSRASYSHILQIVEAAKTGRTGSEIHLSSGLRVGVQRQYLEFIYPEGRKAWRGKLYRNE